VEFADLDQNHAYISDFYRRLYKKPKEHKDVKLEDIENLLGDCRGVSEVENSKISDEEKRTLDRDIGIHELDAAIDKSKKNGSPGIDSFNYAFIKKFWDGLRVPLHKYSRAVLEKGKLTANMKTAKIRLIPKKGDLTKIGNWRPISLLSCFYKLISRVFANRLSLVMDKITKIGQKGYS
jgi:hypothetical protein